MLPEDEGLVLRLKGVKPSTWRAIVNMAYSPGDRPAR